MPIDVDGWTLEMANSTSITQTIVLTGPNTVIPPGGHFRLGTNEPCDQVLSSSLTDAFAARLRDGAIVIDEAAPATTTR